MNKNIYRWSWKFFFLTIFALSPGYANALEADDAFGCWIGEKADGAATYQLEACGSNICGKVVKAAANNQHPDETDLASEANKSFFLGKKFGKTSWTGEMYIFRFKAKSTVTVEIISKSELRVGNSLAKRKWLRGKCPSA